MNYYVKDIKFNRQALSQVYGIMCDYDDEDLEKIPLNVRSLIEANRDFEYNFTINDVDENNKNLLEQTKQILTYLYTNFLSTSEERDVLKRLEYVQYQNSRKYNEVRIDNENQAIKNIIKSNEKTSMVEYKENIFKRIFNAIKRFFLRR